MAKDVLQAVERLARERRAAEAREQHSDIEVVVEGYRRRHPLSAEERRDLEQQRRAMRERLYASG